MINICDYCNGEFDPSCMATRNMCLTCESDLKSATELDENWIGSKPKKQTKKI